MSNVLITGGAGFIPSSLADFLLNQGYEVTLIDNFATGSSNNLPNHENSRFYECDVNKNEEISKIFREESFDYIFHYASLVGVKRTIENPIMVLDDINGLKNIFKLSVENDIKKIFYSSSSEVYGEPVEIPQVEDTSPLNARLPYAVVKNIGECYCRAYKREFDLDYSIFRFFNTYGQKQSPDFVVSKFIKAALNNNDITINGDGSQTRTFCYIDDNLDATVRAFKENLFSNETINIGNDNEISILNLANLIKDILGSSSKIVHLPALEEGDMTRRKPDITKMKKLLNREFTNLNDGIEKIIPYFN
tara:strand:+ start:27028 stop:27945 length:918 start_codon:yes stop_codon:yes gene_type:complete